MAIATLPSPKGIRDVLMGLLGRDITLSTGDVALAKGEQPMVAEYHDDVGRIAACLAVDLPLAIYLGAAVSLARPRAPRRWPPQAP